MNDQPMTAGGPANRRAILLRMPSIHQGAKQNLLRSFDTEYHRLEPPQNFNRALVGIDIRAKIRATWRSARIVNFLRSCVWSVGHATYVPDGSQGATTSSQSTRVNTSA